MCDGQIPVVVDHGSHMCRAGFAGDDMPRAVFPPIVGVPRKTNCVGWHLKDTYVGDEAQPSTDIFDAPLPPLQRGIITNWDSMEKIWHHAFYNELRVAPEDHPMLLTEVPLNPKFNRERMTEIMFETFKCPALYVCTCAVLSLMASGRLTGIVLDSGHDVTHALPIYEGYAIPPCTTMLSYGGNTLTKHFFQTIEDKRVKGLWTSKGKRIVCEMKENVCFVANKEEDLARSPTTGTSIDYKLPDGAVITLGDERFKCSEALFTPKHFGMEALGIHEAIHRSIMMSDKELQKNLFANIVLSGGNTMLKGLPLRLERELSVLDHINTSDIQVVADNHREFCAWIGGSLLASNALFSHWCISKKDYEESGPRIVNWKCF